MNKNLCALRRAADEVKPFVSEPMWAELDAAIRRLEPQARIAKPKGVDSKTHRRAERAIRLKVAYEVASARAGGRCEVCGREGMVLEADHLISGGLRRHRESADTLLMECADCHRARHRNDVAVLERILAVCSRYGMTAGGAAIAARLRKLTTPSVPVRLVVGER